MVPDLLNVCGNCHLRIIPYVSDQHMIFNDKLLCVLYFYPRLRL